MVHILTYAKENIRYIIIININAKQVTIYTNPGMATIKVSKIIPIDNVKLEARIVISIPFLKSRLPSTIPRIPVANRNIALPVYLLLIE